MKILKLFLILLIIMTGNYCFSQEICNNGKDDDHDGLTDLHDPDCQCHFNVTGNLLQNGSFESYNACPVKYSYSAESHIVDYWHYGNYTNNNTASYYHNLSCSYDSIPQNAKIALERFAIFDRWGNRVFSTENRNGAWDGSYKGSLAVAGIYIYLITGKINNRKTQLKGVVTLIR